MGTLKGKGRGKGRGVRRGGRREWDLEGAPPLDQDQRTGACDMCAPLLHDVCHVYGVYTMCDV